ncbi:hypothetical protein GF314_13065 [bacterium]|nr:hypothetical protein [bacterium]
MRTVSGDTPLAVVLATAVGMLTTLLPIPLPAELVVGGPAGGTLSVVDPGTGTLTEYRSLDTPRIACLAYDHLSGKTYAADTSDGVNQILAIDPHSGRTSLIVQLEGLQATIHALAVHPTSGILYAIDNAHADLYRVDTSAGELIPVGDFGVYWISGADFDPVTCELYVCVGGTDGTGALYTIDVVAATATFVASTERLMGLAFDEEGRLYGVDNDWYPDQPAIYRIDRSTGEAETIGEYPGTDLLSIEWMPLDVIASGAAGFSEARPHPGRAGTTEPRAGTSRSPGHDATGRWEGE